MSTHLTAELEKEVTCNGSKGLDSAFFGVTYIYFCLFDKEYGRLLTGFLIKNIFYVLILLGFMHLLPYLENTIGLTLSLVVFGVSFAYIGYKVYFIVDNLVDKLYNFFGK